MEPPDLPPGFTKRLQAHEQLLNAQEFYVLVWGAGKSHTVDYDKRSKIRDDLASVFGENNVFMSEDHRFGQLEEKHGLKVAEAIEAGGVHAVVVLDTSIGPHSELHQFGDIIFGKAIVFVEHRKKESGGFARIAYDALKVDGYTVEEYVSCDTIRRKAKDFLSGVRLRNALRKELGGLFGS